MIVGFKEKIISELEKFLRRFKDCLIYIVIRKKEFSRSLATKDDLIYFRREALLSPSEVIERIQSALQMLGRHDASKTRFEALIFSYDRSSNYFIAISAVPSPYGEPMFRLSIKKLISVSSED